MEKGFTLVEVLVVIAIIILVSGLVFVNYRSGESQFALSRSAYKLAQDIRRAQEMAMSMREYQGSIPKGYGVYLNIASTSQYLIYQDKTNPANEQYDPGEEIETIFFEKGVRIKRITSSHQIGSNSSRPTRRLNINFSPPDPKTTLKDDSGHTFSQVEIVLELIADRNQTKKITVNKVGLITLD